MLRHLCKGCVNSLNRNNVRNYRSTSRVKGERLNIIRQRSSKISITAAEFFKVLFHICYFFLLFKNPNFIMAYQLEFLFHTKVLKIANSLSEHKLGELCLPKHFHSVTAIFLSETHIFYRPFQSRLLYIYINKIIKLILV